MTDKTSPTIEERIDSLSEDRARCALKLLWVAGHVSEHVMEKTLSLAETVRYD